MAIETMTAPQSVLHGWARRVGLLVLVGVVACIAAWALLRGQSQPVPVVNAPVEAIEQPVTAALTDPAPAGRPADVTPRPVLVAPTTPGYYGIVSRQIVQTLADYEAIPAQFPAPDPWSAAGTPGSKATLRIKIRAPYWINDEDGAAQQARSLAKASPELRKLVNEVPAAVRQGKGGPAEIASAMQALLASGYIRGADGAWPPETSDVEAWMGDFGIGADCSAFVYEALSRTQRTLTGAGLGTLARPLEGPPTYVGSRVLATGGELVRNPSDLRVGDMMYRAPYPGNPVGHIRIVDDVQRQDGWIVFNTAEARGDGITGPSTRWWRYPVGSGIANLEEYAAGRWQSAEDREKADVFSRRLPTRTAE